MQRLPGENIHYLVEYFTSEFTIPHSEVEVYDKLAGYIGNSFPDVSKFAKDKLREALPVMHQRLRDASVTKTTVELNSVGEIASALHFYEFHASANDSDIRLLFCCGMIALRYISIAVGFCVESTLYNDFSTLHQQYLLTPYYANTSLKSSKNHRFPQTGLDVVEQTKLLYYANFMRAALSLIANRRCKRTRLLRIVNALVEGPGVKYITGGGMSAQTRRRVTIFEEESEISPLPPPSQQVKKMVEIVRERGGEGLASTVSNQFIGTSEDLRWNRSEMILSEKEGIHMSVTEAVAETEDAVTRVVNIYKIGNNNEKVPISDHVVVSQVQEKMNSNKQQLSEEQNTKANSTDSSNAQAPPALRDAALEVVDNDIALFLDDGNEGIDSESLFKYSGKSILDCNLYSIGEYNMLDKDSYEDDYSLPTSHVETVSLNGIDSQQPQVKVLKTSMELNDGSGRLVRSLSISKSLKPEFSLTDVFGPDETDMLRDLLCSITGGVHSLEHTSSEGTPLSKVFSFTHPEMLSRQLSESSKLVRSLTKDGPSMDGDDGRELSSGSTGSSGLKRSWSVSSVKAKFLDSFLFSDSSESIENVTKKAKTSPQHP